jgi:hypothetical protein
MGGMTHRTHLVTDLLSVWGQGLAPPELKTARHKEKEKKKKK